MAITAARWLIASVVTTMITFSASGAIDRADAKKEAPQEDKRSGVRVLHFPRDRSMGRLMIDVGAIANPCALSNGHGYYQWEYSGEAQGDVAVPTGKRLQLHVAKAAMTNLSALRQLGPNDLYMLTITGMPNDPANPDLTIMPHLAGLTGLEELELEYISISHKGLQYIKDFKSLKYLHIRTDKPLSDGMCYLGGLRSLEILDLGGRCTDSSLSHLAKLTSLKTLSLNVTEVRGSGLVHLEQLPSLRSLRLMGNEFSEAGLAYLRNMTFLKELALFGPGWPLTNAGLANLSHLTSLENLDLHWKKQITDGGMVHLKPMRSLKKLDLWHSQVTDAGLAQLKEMKSLEALELPPHGITDRGLAYLPELTELKHVSVGGSSDSPITDEGLGHLAGLPSIEALHIGGTGITDTGMSHIAGMSSLKTLAIGPGDCQVTNDGLARLATLKSLKTLSLDGTRITVSGLAHLNKLPGMRTLHATSLSQDNTGLNLAKLAELESLTLLFEKGSAIRDEDLACLANLRHLNNLQIPNGAVTDAGMAHLAGLTSMEHLVIGGPDLTDEGIKHLANMGKLDTLSIKGNFTDKGLQHLEGLRGLRSLDILSANNFSQAALGRLRKKLPNLQIFKADKDRETSKKGISMIEDPDMLSSKPADRGRSPARPSRRSATASVSTSPATASPTKPTLAFGNAATPAPAPSLNPGMSQRDRSTSTEPDMQSYASGLRKRCNCCRREYLPSLHERPRYSSRFRLCELITAIRACRIGGEPQRFFMWRGVIGR